MGHFRVTQSSNEELPNADQELETAKRSCSKVTKELHTLDKELKKRNHALGRLNDDLTNLIENVDVTVVMVDNDLKIRRLTASAHELLKILPSDVGRSITNIDLGLPIEDLDKVIMDVLHKLTGVRKEIGTSQAHWYEMWIRPYLTAEKIDGVVISFVDITERKLLENERKQHTEELEKKVDEQAKKIIQSERLAAIGATAGMVGHDIRNPLQTVTGEIYLAKSELKNMPDSEAKESLKECLDTIGEQTLYVNKIVSDLQDYARPLKPQIETVYLESLIQSVLATMKIPENINFDYTLEKTFPKLKIDPSYMQRILANLILNAVQAMPNGGKLYVNAACKNGAASIVVEDTGEGIPEEVRGKLFAPLMTTKSRGQGFGLAVVKRLIDAMGGTVTFESEVGKGTKFILEFPL